MKLACVAHGLPLSDSLPYSGVACYTLLAVVPGEREYERNHCEQPFGAVPNSG